MDRKAETEHEMTETSRDGMTTALLSSGESARSNISARPRNPKIREFLRHTRLQILGKILGRFSGWREEPRKVAMYRSRRIAAFHCLLHLIPLSGAITLLVLRWTHYWVGYNPPDATTLQFVAKFHELLMQVSIVEVMLCIIRSEAIHSFVPLGALSGAIQATQLSYLWSLDFLSMFTLDTFQGRRWRQVMVIIAIPALLISTALVGPSSAVLMIPGPGCPKYAAGQVLNYATMESMFPTHLNRMNGLEMDWTSMNATLLNFEATILYAEEHSNHEIELLNPEPIDNDRSLRFLWDEAPEMHSMVRGHNISGPTTRGQAGVPTNHASYVLGYYAGYGGGSYGMDDNDNGTVSLTISHPITDVTCIDPQYERKGPSEDVYYVQTDITLLGVLGNMSSLAGRVHGRGVLDVLDVLEGGSSRVQYFDPVWLASPEPDSHSLVGVFFSWHADSNSTELQSLDWLLTESEPLELQMFLQIQTCSLKAYWYTADTSITRNQGSMLPTQIEPISKLEPRNQRNITLDVTDINMLWDPNLNRYLHMDSLGPAINLAIAFTLAISKIPSVKYIESMWVEDRPRQYPPYRIRFTKYAYGYSTGTTSVSLSLAVITAYCTITILYLAYILITGSTSTAWNSPIELVALALQSKKPDIPGHTGVGINSLDTCRQGVGIRVNNNDELEIVFASDRDIGSRGLKKIERNKPY